MIELAGIALGLSGLWIFACDKRKGLLPMVIGLVCLIASGAWAQGLGNKHPPEHQALHEKFYKTWMQPQNRAMSCCHNEDCKPAEAHLKDGKWYARQVGDVDADGNKREFTPVPSERVERERDSPDGRSHLCGKRYDFNGGEFTVLCFLPAGGA